MSVSRLILAVGLLATPAFAQETPVEESCGLSLLAFSRFKVTSAHMEPNFLTGRCYAYAPFDGPPERGDVVTFPAHGTTHFMRLIGLPGDTVQMQGGRLILNGERVPTEPFTGDRPDCAADSDCAGEWLVETLPGGPGYLVLDLGASRSDDTATTTVPDGMTFVLGDNRDRSSGSRFSVALFGMGLIPIDSLQRRAKVAE